MNNKLKPGDVIEFSHKKTENGIEETQTFRDRIINIIVDRNPKTVTGAHIMIFPTLLPKDYKVLPNIKYLESVGTYVNIETGITAPGIDFNIDELTHLDQIENEEWFKNLTIKDFRYIKHLITINI